MYFIDRRDAGMQLARCLDKYNCGQYKCEQRKSEEIAIFALPRGGVVVAAPIAHELHAPLSIVLAHKIGHPHCPEYAIAAVSEGGHLLAGTSDVNTIDKGWLQQAVATEMKEIKRRRSLYLQASQEINPAGKTIILVDDGIATGLTLQAGILWLQSRGPKKIVVAVPVAPRSVLQRISGLVDECVSILTPPDEEFLGAVGAYYLEFNQVQDQEVVSLLSQGGSKDR